MKALATALRRAAKFSLIASAAVIVALALARDGRPAAADGAGEIVISQSDTAPTPVTSLVLMAGGEPLDLYVWIKNLVYQGGASAFQVKFTYAGDIVHVTHIYPDTAWLGQTGRSVACLGAGIDNEQGEAYVTCNTLQIPPPYGPEGTGKLAKITVAPMSEVALTALDFTVYTWLVDTPPNPDDIQQIPVKAPAVTVQVAHCADFDGGGVRVADILYVVQRYFGTDLTADLNKSGNVNVSDILISVQEYFQDCPA